KILCKGSAQFASQFVGNSPISVQRYDIGPSPVVTLVMQWRKDKVTFMKFDMDDIHLGALPSVPSKAWTTASQAPDNAPVPNDPNFMISTPSDLLEYIPDTNRVTPYPANTPAPPRSCARLHLNFWLGNFPGRLADGTNPPPGSRQEVLITNF